MLHQIKKKEILNECFNNSFREIVENTNKILRPKIDYIYENFKTKLIDGNININDGLQKMQTEYSNNAINLKKKMYDIKYKTDSINNFLDKIEHI